MIAMAFDSAMCLKLLLATSGFWLIAHYGTRDKRTAGVLLTFPLLNGMALLDSSDPMRVAGTIYPLVIFNSVLFWAAITSARWLPPWKARFSANALLMTRVLVWGAAWGFAGYFVTEYHEHVSGGPIWLLAYALLATSATVAFWKTPSNQATAPAQSASRYLSAWGVRLSLFVLAFLCLSFVAHYASDQKWVGMAGAFPLPGIFAVASVSVITREDQLRSIRDTVLLGPMLVIPFTWLFGHAVLALPTGVAGTSIGIAALVAGWAISFGIVMRLVPFLEGRLDGAPRGSKTEPASPE